MILEHVALTVSDRARSAAFYARHFGLTTTVHEDPQLLILGGAGGGLPALSQGAPAADGLPRTNHFGVRASEDAVRAARERFRADGVRETEWQDDRGFVRCQGVVEVDRDPCGVRPMPRVPGDRQVRRVRERRVRGEHPPHTAVVRHREPQLGQQRVVERRRPLERRDP